MLHKLCKAGGHPAFVLLFFIGVLGINDWAQAQSSDRRITADPGRQLFQPAVVDNYGINMRIEELLMEEYIDPETYVLGPGDMFSVDLQGEVQQSLRGLVVNGEGNIFIPSVGKIELKELTLDEARDRINDRIDEQFSETTISVSLDRPRPIKVNVHGDVKNPGSYIVPFQTRVDQAIYGAVNEDEQTAVQDPAYQQYSLSELQDMPFALRNIRVVSENGNETSADLIRYFRTGQKDANPYVSDGDVIHVQNRIEEGPQVSISGGVNTPMDLEYRRGDNLQALLDIAGGYSSDADTTKFKIYRRNETEIDTRTINSDEQELADIELQANDKVVVPIDRDLHRSQKARAGGELEMPGSFPIIDGETTVNDLIQMAGGLTESALKNGAFLLRSETGGDRTLKEPQPIHEQLMRTSDQYMQGFEYLELEAAVARNQVHIDLTDDEMLENIHLYSGDELVVPKDENTVFMMGQVNDPGYYSYDSQSVDSFISEAGGYALAAEESRVFIIKAGSRSWYTPEETDVESGDIIFVDRVPYDDLQALRSYRQGNIQLILTGISTVTSVITAYLAIFR